MNPQPQYQSSSLPKGWIAPNNVAIGESKWRLIFGYTAFMLLSIPALRYICLPSTPFDQQILGYILFGVCTFPIITHFSSRRPGVPVFPIICLVYAMSYALPVFHSPPILLVNTRRGYVRILDEFTLDAVGMAILGVSSMILGFWFFRFSLLNALVPKVELELDPKKGKSLAIFLGFSSIGFMMIWVGGVINVPAQFLALVALLSHFGTLSIAYLYYEHLQGRCSARDNLVLVVLIVMAFGIGMSMGTVRNASEPLIAVAAVQWTVKQKISLKYATLGILLFFAIQSIKGIYRSMLQQAQGEKTSMAERVKIMQTVIEIGVEHWLSSDKVKVAGAGDTASALSRTDIIHLFAHTISKTPRVVPYQYGETYNYFIYAFIPRAIWKNKPSAQVANEFFGVAYELQDASNIGTTSIGMAHLVEAYINFGGFGVFFIMLILGMFYAAIDQIFSHAKAGGGSIAIYSTMLFNLINIETATAPTFGAIVQTIAIYIIVLRFARARKVTP